MNNSIYQTINCYFSGACESTCNLHLTLKKCIIAINNLELTDRNKIQPTREYYKSLNDDRYQIKTTIMKTITLTKKNETSITKISRLLSFIITFG